MIRIARGCVIATGVALPALWLIVTGHAPDPAPLANVPVPPHASCAHDRLETTDSREIALFQEIVKARQTALMEAQTLVPPQDGGRLPLVPSSVLQKGAGKRDLMASARAAKMLAVIAHAHGITRKEIEDIYRRGEAGDWPTTP